jgi:DNA helicase-2/ATP-dependent DNA helicase PcrA
MSEIEKSLLADLNDDQREIVKAPQRCILVIAGADSGKTEVMARRVAWWLGVDHVAKVESAVRRRRGE